LDHPCIVHMYGIHTDSEGEKYIVTELLSKGSAVDLIQNHYEELTLFDFLTM
jgi:serine/threonine protein kinase